MPHQRPQSRGFTAAPATTVTGLTATRFAWRCLGSPPWPAPTPVPDPVCWLCGGDTEGQGWQRADALSPSFTSLQRAAAPTSPVVCEPCAYFASGDAWRQYAADHPAMNLKTGHAVGWRSYSHLFTPDGHATPTRAGWRDLLLYPPAGPYLAVIALSGQKHLIYRGAVCGGGERLLLQVEEERLHLTQPQAVRALGIVEALVALGCARDEIASGRYAPGRVKPAQVARWHDLADAATDVRRTQPGVLALACWCARRAEG